MWKGLMVCVGLAVAGCAANSTTPIAGTETVKTYPAHTRPLRLVLGDLPPGTQYEVLAKVKAIDGYYGSSDGVERKIAEDARQIGADAIIQTKIWFAPRAFAWAAPHAEGVAVKLAQPESVDFEKLPGSTR
jgi:hypothetical protein